MNILAIHSYILPKLESLKNEGQLQYVKNIEQSTPLSDIEKGKNRVTDGKLYIYPTGSRIDDVAGSGKVLKMKVGTGLTFCVEMKTAKNKQALEKMGETIYALIAHLSDYKFTKQQTESHSITMSELIIDNETREQYLDGYYYYSIRVFSNIHIHKKR